MGRKLEASLAVLNGFLGDHLAKTGNGLATEMVWLTRLPGGAAVSLARAPLAQTLQRASPHVAVLVHGLMCTESIWEMPDGTDYGSRLEADAGITPLYVRYNSGLAIAESGAALARQLDTLVREYPAPIEELTLIGHSMGGLVIRSACHVARTEGQAWLALVKRAVYVGTPHDGAPLERVGRVVARVLRSVDDPYTRLIAEIADLRSDGIKDLGDAALRHEDRDRSGPRVSLMDPAHPVPLLPEIRHYLVAGSISEDPWLAWLFGDALVPVASATGGHARGAEGAAALPSGHVRVMPGISHLRIAHEPAVYELIRQWC
ncbi:MAG: esterase/lipase family protein, partial [Polyangiaceae bacterium]